MAAYNPQDRWNHRAGFGLVQPTRPAPTAQDRKAELMRANVNLSPKTAERMVLELYPEHAGAFPTRG